MKNTYLYLLEFREKSTNEYFIIKLITNFHRFNKSEDVYVYMNILRIDL